jgi:hypothetical protein
MGAKYFTQEMDEPHKTILEVPGWIYFVLIFLGSSLAGIARMLWILDPDTNESHSMKWYRWFGAACSCGFFGLIVSLWLYEDFLGSPEKLAGIALLAGLGGSTTFDFVLAWLRTRFGLKNTGK